MSVALTSSVSWWMRPRRVVARGVAVAALILAWDWATDGQLAARASVRAIEGTCGNGVPDPGEDCDDSGDSPTCDGDCTVVECGDGYRNAMAGEQCDDQNTIDGDCCDSTCVIEPNGSACDGDGDVCNGDEICNAVGVCGPSPPPRLITEIINGTGGGGDDILAGVEGVAVDSAGNAYVVGSVSQNVFRITPAGGITEIIDATGDGTNPLLKPFDIATDAAGNVYVAGANSDNAFRVTPGGVITQIIDSTCDGSGNTLLAPHGIAVDGFGNVYVTGRDSDNAFRITPNGEITQIIDAAGDGSSLLSDPFAVATDHAGNVYVAGRASDNVFRITPGGAVTEIIDESGDGANVLDCGTFTQCDVAVDVFGNVHVSAFASDNAFRITPAGSITETIDITGDGANPLDGPHGIAADGQGSVYLSGTNSDNAFKIDPSGSIVEIIDMTGDGAGAGLDGPDLSSVAADGPGVVYVGGVFSNNVFRIETLSRALECDDGIACTLDVCDPVLGCQSVPAAEGESCDDDNACTIDSCDQVTGCLNVPVPAGASCDDGNVCNGDDVCDAVGVCQPGIALVCGDGDACNGVELCDPAIGCRPGVTLDCDDANSCTDDFCSPTGGCDHTPLAAGTSCGDNDVCNGQEVCDAEGACLPATGTVITQIIDGNGDCAGNLLEGAEGVETDPSGNVYVVGAGSQNVLRITPFGEISEIIDSSGDGTSPLLGPFGVAVDPSGNVYVAGVDSNNAFRISPGGVITEIIDVNGDGAGNGLLAPHGMAADGSGNAYVTGRDSGNAFRIGPTGEITEMINATGSGTHELVEPFAVVTDAAGNVFVAGRHSDNVFKITPGGVITEIIGRGGDGNNDLNCGNFTQCDLAVDSFGNVYVSGFASDNAFKVTPGGTIAQIIDASGDGVNTLDGPHGIASDGEGNAYVTGGNSDNMFRVGADGSIAQIVDASGDGVGNEFDGPDMFSVTVDQGGTVYASGFFSNNVLRVQQLGAELVCDDSNPCTLDSCDPIDGCVTAPNFDCLPPAVPDGTTGSALTVQKVLPDATRLQLSFDIDACPGNVDHHVVYGYGSQLPAGPGGEFVVEAGECGIGTSPFNWVGVPDSSTDPTRLLWFVVLANDGVTTEGSWGQDDLGQERQGPAANGSSGQCGMTDKALSNTCGQ